MNLFERISEDIPIHGIVGLLNEAQEGHRTLADIKTIYNLDAAQQTELSQLVILFNNSIDKKAFKDTFERFLMLKELGVMPEYYGVRNNLVTRLQAV